MYIVKHPGVALLPNVPVHKDDHGIKILAHVLWCTLPHQQPPLLRAWEALIRYRKVWTGSGLDQLPDLGGKGAVHEQVKNSPYALLVENSPSTVCFQTILSGTPGWSWIEATRSQSCKYCSIATVDTPPRMSRTQRLASTPCATEMLDLRAKEANCGWLNVYHIEATKFGLILMHTQLEIYIFYANTTHNIMFLNIRSS
jgi:hypothetical protein